MSLYIGNLSSRSRQDELQHVFQKFGRCNVRLKDGYGFVVYEYPPNAEKALRALQKKYICGESLTLTWSNKQPRPFKRLARSLRSYQPQQGRDSLRGGDYVKEKSGSNNQDYRMSAKQSDGISKRHRSTEKHDKEPTYHVDDTKDNLGEEHPGYGEDFLDKGDRLEQDQANSDRWGKQLHDQGNENGVENDIEFDRYVPHQGYDRKYDDDIHQRACIGGSRDLQSPRKDIGREQIDEVKLKYPTDAKLMVTCYRCGGSGHKMRNCTQENTSLRKSTRHDNGINRRGAHENELQKFRSRYRERLQSSGGAIPKGQPKSDLKSSKHQRPISRGISPVGKKTDESKKEQYGGNKRSKKEIGSPKRHSTKKSRRSFSSPSNSDHPASPSCLASQSSQYVKRSHSHYKSRSISSRAGSLLSESSSSSTSHCSRSKILKSSARSISHASLSVSIGQLLPSSSNKAQFNMKGYSDNAATTPESDTILIEKGQQVEGDNCLDDAKLENRMVAANNEDTALPSRTVIEIENDNQPLKNDHEDHKVASGSLYEVTNPSILAAEKSTVDVGSFSPQGLVEMDCQNSDELMTEHVPVPLTNLDSQHSVGSRSVRSTSLSSEELCMVLKHYYGLNQVHLPAEAYFGSARLWPWEVIYYRRLKKGPISIENYARRVDQNREFGIIDKYIRSSSGWEELSQVNP